MDMAQRRTWTSQFETFNVPAMYALPGRLVDVEHCAGAGCGKRNKNMTHSKGTTAGSQPRRRQPEPQAVFRPWPWPYTSRLTAGTPWFSPCRTIQGTSRKHCIARDTQILGDAGTLNREAPRSLGSLVQPVHGRGRGR